MAPSRNQTMLSASDVAALLGMSVRLVCYHATRGNLPGQKIGSRTWVFRKVDVEGWKPRPVGRPKTVK